MKPFIIIGLIVCCACSSRASLMTQSEYDTVQTGTPVATLESQIGTPYDIHFKSGGVKEYEYIERITMGNSLVTENHYFIIVVDGKVVGKYMKQEKAPAYHLIYEDDPNHQWYP